MTDENVPFEYIACDVLVKKALELKPQGNIGIAFTYNEPLVGYEFVLDCAVEAHKRALKTVVVTNGYICGEPLKKLLAHIDAFNIDLKRFTPEWYARLGGDLETVQSSIRAASERCHVEITTLIVNGENDSVEEMKLLAQWLRQSIKT